MISKSPQRNTFQKEGYLERQSKKGKTPENDEDTRKMLEYYNSWDTEENAKISNPDWRKNNLEWDLRTTSWILEKARTSESYAQNLYAAICNMQWCKKEMWPLLKEDYWSCSWRYAGGIIANMRQEGDYIDWYCSGIAGGDEPDVYNAGHDLKRKGYVPEGIVTEEIEADLNKLGWIPVPYKDDVI